MLFRSEGEESLGRRALQLVIMKKQLEQMAVELREMMIYNAPPELGGLWTDVSEMMNQIGGQQKILLTRKMRDDAERIRQRKKLLDKYFLEGMAVLGLIATIAVAVIGMAIIVHDRIEKYPQLGTGWVPKTEKQRREEAEPKVYIGR